MSIPNPLKECKRDLVAYRRSFQELSVGVDPEERWDDYKLLRRLTSVERLYYFVADE